MKAKTHVYLAHLVLQDALHNRRITMYTTDYAKGIVGPLLGDFEFDFHADYQRSLQRLSDRFVVIVHN